MDAPPDIPKEILDRYKFDKLEPPLGPGVVFTIAMALLFIGGIMGIAYLGEQARPINLALEVVAEDLAFPIKFDVAYDGRIFYNEFITGNIRIIEDGVVLEKPFATVDVFVEGGATGLIGLALHPSAPYVYVFYTYSRLSGEAVCIGDLKPPVCEEGIIVANRVSRFPIDSPFRNPVNPLREQVIIENLPTGKWAPKMWDHFGGDLKFGPDGKLYVSVGDATNHLAAQDLSRLNGKILRLNPDGSVPESNPFPGSPIFLYGVRNVFGMTFVGDTLFFSDNGPVGHDEVNIAIAGGNYGWPYFAGNETLQWYEIPDGTYFDPLIDFTPAIVPTAMAYLDGATYLGSFLNYNLMVLQLGEDGWYVEEVLYVGFSVMDMVAGRDGYLYLSTFDKIVRVVLQ